jgi:hypothetical protein
MSGFASPDEHVHPVASWQRWTIDEIVEETVRVLIADGIYPLESTAAEALDDGSATELRDAVAQDEAVSPDDIWLEERAEYMDAGSLRELLRGKAEAPGLPDARELREGDVFWVVLPPQLIETMAMDAGPLHPLRHLQAPGAQVLDVTAASRAAARHLYDAVLRGAPPPE